MSETINFLERPYSDRQLIVVTEDELADAAKKEERKTLAEKQQGIDWKRIAETAILDVIPIPFTRLTAEITREAFLAWGRAKQEGVQVTPVGKKNCSNIKFPIGHPRDGVLYIGHPAVPNVYFTMAEFHRVVFQHKFCEAAELLMSLGATKIRVEHISGWSSDFSSRISVPLGSVESSGNVEVDRNAKSRSHLLYEATLTGNASPKVPEYTVWFSHEPTWQSIAKGRLNYGLRGFSLSVSYEDDFGINAGLRASVQKAGLDLGGKFEDHKATIWHLNGTFGPD